MNTATHPGRSYDFLSRLHDGDLSAGERAHFESHRAHCAECRHAAAEFESALSLYRATPTSPASPDLAGRILRRLQTASPRRRPFGIFHGIDVRWAGAFAAALIAMIIGSAVVLRQQASGPKVASTAPIPVELEKSRPETRPANVEQPLARNRSIGDAAPGRADADAPAEAVNEAKSNTDALKAAVEPSDAKREARIAAAAPPAAQVAAAPPPAPASAPAKEKDAAARPAPVQETSASAGRAASRDEPSGGERSGSAAYDFAAAESNVRPRLEITALDGEGTPPRTLQEPELAAEHRGRTFVLIVSASGQVLEVLPQPEEAQRRAQEEGAKRQKMARREEPDTLTGLRFETGNRPRRLLLTVR